MDFEAVFKIIINGFDDAKIKFALIGGFALASAGYPRATKDIDFLIDRDDLPAVKNLMASFGYELIFESDDIASFASQLTKLGRVDFLLAHRRYARAMLERAEERQILGRKARVVIPEDVIGLKVQSSSNDPERKYQDLADIEALMKINKGKLNLEIIKEYFGIFNRGKEYEEIMEKINNAK